jgi:hypothetical protein
MKASTLIKIGIIGTASCIFAGFIPILAAVSGNDAINQWLNNYINEGSMTVLLFIFAAILIYGARKKIEES